MYKQTNFSDENKKRAAFRRFSQIGATGLAVLSLSAFTDLAAQQLPEKVDTCSVKERSTFPDNTLPAAKQQMNEFFINNEERINSSDPDEIERYGKYNNAYVAHSNYSDYSNNYSDQCN